MGKNPITDMNHLVVISFFALPLNESVPTSGGRVELWVDVVVSVRLQCQMLSMYKLYITRRYIVTLWYKVSCCIIEEDCVT